MRKLQQKPTQWKLRQKPWQKLRQKPCPKLHQKPWRKLQQQIQLLSQGQNCRCRCCCHCQRLKRMSRCGCRCCCASSSAAAEGAAAASGRVHGFRLLLLVPLSAHPACAVQRVARIQPCSWACAQAQLAEAHGWTRPMRFGRQKPTPRRTQHTPGSVLLHITRPQKVHGLF